jgi:hypothetical protein
MDMVEVAKAFGLGAVPVIALAVFAYFFREALASALARSVNRDIVKLSGELKKELELLRHALNREAHKEALVATKRHEVYPESMERLHRAHEAVMEVLQGSSSRLLPAIAVAPEARADALVSDAQAFLTFKALHFGEEPLRLARQAISELRYALKAHQPNSKRSWLGGGSGYEPTGGVLGGLKATAAVNAAEEAMRDELRPVTDLPET